MTSRISGACCASNIKPDQYKSSVWESLACENIRFSSLFAAAKSEEKRMFSQARESHVRQQILVVVEDFYR